jgi:2-dehydropantoate 2-reductase
MKVAVLGAGGVGGYFGGLLARAGHEVTFIARGDHLRAIQRDGLTVHSAQAGDFHVSAAATDEPATVGPVDLVLFCVKSFDTESAARAMLPLVGPQTLVLSLQNGIDNEDVLASVIPRNQVLGGVARIESTIAAPGVIDQLSPFSRVGFGELDGPPTPRCERLLETFQAAAWRVELLPDVRQALWDKFIGLSAWAGISALAPHTTYADLTGQEYLREAFLEAIREGVAVARADGYDFPDYAEQALRWPVRPGMKTSMQRDRERGRRIEVDALSGATVRLGRRYGVPTPVNLTIYAALKAYDDRVRADIGEPAPTR